VEVVNIIILAALSYGMTVVDYNQVELNKLNRVIHSYIRKRLCVSPADTKGWEAWLTLNKDRGGKVLHNIKDLHDANKLNAFLYATLGPASPAQSIIKDELHCLNTGSSEITIKEDSVWSPVISALERSNTYSLLCSNGRSNREHSKQTHWNRKPTPHTRFTEDECQINA
jgi:hypothetical protein